MPFTDRERPDFGWDGFGIRAVPELVDAILTDEGVRPAGTDTPLRVGETTGSWTLTASTPAGALFEDLSRVDGDLVVLLPDGVCIAFPRSAEASTPGDQPLYAGRGLEDVLASPHDLLGAALLGHGDPDPAAVAAALAPITDLAVHTFIGTPETIDKVGFEYGGRTPNVDPAVYDSRMSAVRRERRVLDGLVGGWLPAVRFVYPVGAEESPADEAAPARPWMDLPADGGARPAHPPAASPLAEPPLEWFEVIAFAPFRVLQDNRAVQPVWYRIAQIRDGRLVRTHYIDTFPPVPPALDSGDAAGFVADLLAFAAEWRDRTAGAAVRIPDARLAHLARHSLVKAIMTRFGDDPKYGVLDRLYGGAEHDGFQDTFTTDLAAAVEWGHTDRARRILENYLSRFVRDDGSLLYRGPGTGQYGRMLTAIAQYALSSGDTGTVEAYRTRIDAIARLLLDRRATSLELPADDPGHGLIAGWCEADSCLEADPARYHLPYLSNSAEAVRGWAELARMWRAVAETTDDDGAGLRAWADELDSAAEGLRADLVRVVERSTRWDQTPPWLPVIAGAAVPFDIAVSGDAVDPQFRAYRANMELVYSGVLPAEAAERVIDYRAARHDIVCGVPCAYGYDTAGGGEPRHGELAVFLSYGHAWGLLRADRIEDFVLELHGLAFHGNTRGSWTAPETRRIHPGLAPAPYAVPAQLAVPMMLRWALVWEDPVTDTIWLGRGAPRTWLEDGGYAAENVPTTHGPVSVRVTVDSPAAAGAGAGDRMLRYEVGARSLATGTALRLRLRLRGRAGAIRIVGDGTAEVADAPGGTDVTIALDGAADSAGRYAGAVMVGG